METHRLIGLEAFMPTFKNFGERHHFLSRARLKTQGLTGEMVQQLRALAVLPEDLSSVPSTHTGWSTNTVYFSFRDPQSPSLTCRHRHTHTQTHTHIHTHTDRYTHTYTQRERYTRRDRYTHIHIHRETHTQTHTDRHTDAYIHKHIQIDTQTHIHTQKHIDRYTVRQIYTQLKMKNKS